MPRRDRSSRRAEEGRRETTRNGLACALGILLAAAGTAGAQDDQFLVFTRGSSFGLEINFSNPGARSLGMGGAFVGRADDATAAYANPAGLVQLREPELSLEGRSWGFPSEIGFLVTTEVDQTSNGVAFLSYVYPRKRWVLALYRHELADYGVRTGTQSSTVRLDGYGLAGGYRFDGGLSVGASVVVYDVSVDTAAPCCVPGLDPPGQILVQRARHTDLQANLGLLWQIDRRWSLGAVYRRHPDMDVTGRLLAPGVPPREVVPLTFQIPDVLGLGVGLRATSRLQLNLDYVIVRWSHLLDFLEDPIVRSLLPPRADLGTTGIPDRDEFHFGLEYSFWNRRGAPALRLGAWFDPDHRVGFTPVGRAPDCDALPPPVPSAPPSDDQLKCILIASSGGGGDRLHVSAGFGIVFGQRLQLDAAADFSDDTQTFSLSTLVRF